jgi:hypothetical protein
MEGGHLNKRRKVNSQLSVQYKKYGGFTMNWYKSARGRSGKFLWEFDNMEFDNPTCFCHGRATIHWSISRDPGDRYEPPTSDVNIKAELEEVECFDIEDNIVSVTPEMEKNIVENLEDDERVEEAAYEHEFD